MKKKNEIKLFKNRKKMFLTQREKLIYVCIYNTYTYIWICI